MGAANTHLSSYFFRNTTEQKRCMFLQWSETFLHCSDKGLNMTCFLHAINNHDFFSPAAFHPTLAAVSCFVTPCSIWNWSAITQCCCFKIKATHVLASLMLLLSPLRFLKWSSLFLLQVEQLFLSVSVKYTSGDILVPRLSCKVSAPHFQLLSGTDSRRPRPKKSLSETRLLVGRQALPSHALRWLYPLPSL